MKSVLIQPLQAPLEVSIELPGSKSHANRAIVCAALARGKTLIRGAVPCDDVLVMVAGLQKLGFSLQWLDRPRGLLEVSGGIPTVRNNGGAQKIDCHNAGTALRFLTSVAALVPGEWILTGNKHMLRRPIADLVHALRSLGARIEDNSGGLPLRIQGGLLSGSSVTLKADISSQYLTSLLLIGSALPSGLTIQLHGPLASSGYVKLTEKVLKDFSVRIEKDARTYRCPPSSYRATEDYSIEGDWSSAGAWLALGALTGSSIEFPNLSRTSEQSDRLLPGIIQDLRSMGERTVDVTEIPDQLMNLAVVAAFRTGVTKFIGARNLRHKECDRLHVLTKELKKAGVHITEQDDGVTVRGPLNVTLHQPVLLDPHDDHRMVMAFTVLGLLRGGVSIRNPRCVAKSYPQFFPHLAKARKSIQPLAIVGMRGVGKSSLGRRLASALKVRAVDTDHLIRARVGDIGVFVERSGWSAFRKEEVAALERAVKPGYVISLGGGATETSSIRKILRHRCIGIWIQATEEDIVKRLSEAKKKRPKLTGHPLKEEVHQLLTERTPGYKEVSMIELPASLTWNQQVPYILRALVLHFRGALHREYHPCSL